MRIEVMKLIEEFIFRSKPEALECVDSILPAMMVALEDRYGRERLMDVAYEYQQLKEALTELDSTTPPSAEDEAYELRRAQETH